MISCEGPFRTRADRFARNWAVLSSIQDLTLKAFGTLRDGIDGQVRSFGERLDGGIKAIDDRAAAIAAKLNDDMVQMRTEANANRESLRSAIEQKLDQNIRQQADASKTLRDELGGNFHRLGSRVATRLTEASQIQKERLHTSQAPLQVWPKSSKRHRRTCGLPLRTV